jgi:hypothetical protein
MAVGAKVTSVDAIEQFKANLIRFKTDAGNALASLDMGIRRAFDWLEGQQKHWQTEVRQWQEFANRAKAELIQFEYGRAETRGPGYTEKQIALHEAQSRLRQAEARVQSCKRWARVLPCEVIECEGPARQLAGMLEADLRQAIALVDHKIRALESYLSLTSSTGAGPEAPEPSKEATGSDPV